jgi:hypothetical protein
MFVSQIELITGYAVVCIAAEWAATARKEATHSVIMRQTIGTNAMDLSRWRKRGDLLAQHAPNASALIPIGDDHGNLGNTLVVAVARQFCQADKLCGVCGFNKGQQGDTPALAATETLRLLHGPLTA